MIFSALLALVPHADVAVAHGGGWLTHGMAFRLVQAGSPRVAERLHDSAGALLVSSGVLRGGPESLPDFTRAVMVRAGQPVWVRLTALGQEAALAACEGLAALPEFDLGPGTPCDIVERRVLRGPGGDLPRLLDLWQVAAAASAGVTLEFLTPTAFVRRNKLELALPVPERVFGSPADARGLVGRWMLAGGPDVFDGWSPEYVGAVPETLAGQRVRLGQRGGVTGFLGRCRFDTSRDKTALRQLWALARFAEFAGVGVKTGMGLGQVRVV
jgi:CRISPR-associated endoribonuclease Cas6